MAGFLKIASFALLVSNTHGVPPPPPPRLQLPVLLPASECWLTQHTIGSGSGSWEGEFEDEESGSWIGSGSQEGECDDGYDYDGTSCVDVDECTDGVDNCDANAACTNIEGSFVCACDSGYTGDGTACTDIDECTDGADNCDANAVCTNTVGSFTCACDSGYTGDGTACTDIDECTDGVDNCDANAACANTAGSFTCACGSGYTGDGTACTDINECGAEESVCHADATCTNLDGTHTCACGEGFTGDGTTCAELPESAVVSYKWYALTAYEPLFCPTDTCGTRPPQTRTVICQAKTVDGASTSYGPALDSMCSGAKPPESINCTASQDNDKCDDGDPETMGDVCTGSSCAGKVALVAAVTFAMPTAALQDLRIPTEDVDASPLANAVKQSLVSALASSMTGLTADDITILGLSTARRRRLQAGGSLVVDYKIEVAAAQATDTVKTAATTAAAAITTVTIPAEATVSSTEITPTVTATAEAFVSYAYVKTAGTCPATPCSDVCGVDETTEPDTYACEADGAASADASCVGAGLVEPVTVTACCPAADVATCVEPAAPPPPDAPEPEPEPESESDTPWAAIIGGGAGGLVLLGVIYAVATDSCKKAEPKAEDKKEKIEADLSANRQQQDAIAP